LYKLRPIVRRTLVTTNKGKSGLIELPYTDPSQQHHILQQQQQRQQQQHYSHHIYATNASLNSHNDLHCDLYTDPYGAMENEAKKVSDIF
jgi:hypothetical protein